MNTKILNKKKNKISIGILGASGYTGSELLRILCNHPKVNIKCLIGDRSRGKKIGSIFSHFSHANLPTIKGIEDINYKEVDLIFSCMPNGRCASIISKIPKGVKIIDLSADFRFKEKNIYESYYDKHPSIKYLEKFIYGLSEINRSKIKKNNYVSCPGCYPTSILLAVIPLIKSGKFKIKEIIADSKSGLSGAGRKPKENLMFAENYANSLAYGNGNHRHKPEMEHQVYLVTKKKLIVNFIPHLIPINRGILSSIYIKGDGKLANRILKRFYQKQKFVQINEINESPKISDVVGSNICKIGIIENNKSKYITIISVIDNLIKGASGQAVQNMNLMCNFSEELGLDNQSIWP